MRVWPAAVARVKEEVADMQALAAREGDAITIEPWDYLYYAEKVRKAKYDLDQDAAEAVLRVEQHGCRGAVVRRAALRHPLRGDHRHGAGVPS